ncbi:LytR/AlgR family response regulator transcription factor [Niallia sp. Krafla_26]|uniref:LytR/AlgR family response regulator transcription factor n=1 Tax=Niallia sp. Krafla_26 TaxID=3064703 RepID=UPI003D170D33
MQPTISTIVVDDEPYNREELIYLLQAYSSIQIVGEADSGEACVMQAIQKQPDLIFLDVEMPAMNGLQVAEILNELKKPPLIVFATAFPEFAVQAFRYEAIDYLLKPYDEDQLHQTIQRIEKRIFPTDDADRDLGTANKLGVENDGEVVYLDPNDILYIYSEEKRVNIVTSTQSFETKKTLKDLELRLSTYPFFRTHKSYLVNLHYITRLTPWFNGAFNLTIKGKDKPIPVSRNYVKALREQLEL